MPIDIEACCQALTLNHAQLEEIRDTLCQRIAEGLQREGAEIQALLTYLPQPQGALEGTALVIDVGGTNMRAALVRFNEGKAELVGEPVHGQVPTGRESAVTAEDFFDTQAKLAAQLNPPADIPVGYCFSYPARITPEVDATLISWTKGIAIPGVEGHSVGLGLRRALEANGMRPGRLVVLNDTVATLLAGAGVFSADRFLGLIAGTGINMAGFTPLAEIAKLGESSYKYPQMAINLESGNFHPPYLSPWDDMLDSESDNPGRQRFEKACSGYYLPFLYLTIAKAQPELKLAQFDPMLGTGHLVKLALEQDDKVAMAILRRSAQLIAATLAGFMKHMGPGKCAIVAEGSRYWKDPTQAPLIPQLMNTLITSEQSFTIDSVDNANFIGSACAVLGVLNA